jgi:hypothetical protein
MPKMAQYGKFPSKILQKGKSGEIRLISKAWTKSRERIPFLSVFKVSKTILTTYKI